MKEVVLGKYIGVQVPAKLQEKERDDYLVQEILKDSEVEVPKEMALERAKGMLEDYDLRLSQQGLSLQQYYAASKSDEKALVEKLTKIAERQLKGRLLLIAIARQENITVSEADVEAEIEKMTIRYPIGKEEIRKIMKGKEEMRLREQIKIKKALDYVKERAVEIE